MDYLSYTAMTLREAAGRALHGLPVPAPNPADLQDFALAAAAALLSGTTTVRPHEAARIAKAARDVFSGGSLSFSDAVVVEGDEAAFFARRRMIAVGAGGTAMLIGERLFDGFNTERGIRIISRRRSTTTILDDGPVQVEIPFTFDDDAPEQGEATFVALIDPATLQPIDAYALDGAPERFGNPARFGFVSSVVMDELATGMRGGLEQGYRLRLEEAVAAPTRKPVLSPLEKATILSGWVTDYMVPETGVTNLQSADAAVTERYEDGSFRMEASGCYDRDNDRFRSYLVVHVGVEPFYIDAAMVDESGRAVGWLDMHGREQAYEAAGLDLDSDWAFDYEERRGADPLQKHLDSTSFGP